MVLIMGQKLQIKLSSKQTIAYKHLTDKKTKEIFYGGAASGGKSWLGCTWLMTMCIAYPGTRYLMGRAVLKRLKDTTLLTMFEVLKTYGFKSETDYFYNSQNGVIRFYNESEIYLKDLFQYPSDPQFDSLGSSEYTGAYIDEATEITQKAKNIVQSRLRYKIEKYNLVPKLLVTSNPGKNFLYYEYYVPWKQNKLPEYKVFIQSLIDDNPYVGDFYKENLKNLDEQSKKRLLHGNWEYSNDPSQLCSSEKIRDVFLNEHIPEGESYITSDLAMQGRDRFIIMSWSGMRCHIELIKGKSSGREIEQDLRGAIEKHQVSRSNTIVDSDGLGQYLESYLNGIREFHGGEGAFNKELYANRKSECAYKLAEVINKGQLYIETSDEELKSIISAELEQLKRDKIDDDTGKLRLIKKDVMKENIGHSPDFLDCLLMRMAFEIGESYAFLEDSEGLIF